jgi:hypothetical protein
MLIILFYVCVVSLMIVVLWLGIMIGLAEERIQNKEEK